MEIDTTLERVQAQLTKLERDHRNLKLSVLILFGALLLLSWMTEKRGRLWIEAGGFAIKDEQGVIRGIFSTFGGDAYVTLNGANGKAQAEMRVAPFGPSLALYSAEGKGAVHFRLGPRGTDVYFIDADQKPRMTLTAGPQGTLLKLSDERGMDRIMLGVQSGSEGAVSPQEQQTYSLIITDQEGKTLFTVPQSIP